jgi:HEAT repeat protein
VRIGAATALTRFGGKAVPHLQTALKDKEPRVRQYTALAIGELKASPADALPLIALAQKDENIDVRIAAAVSLGRFGISAVPQLIAAFRDPEQKVWFQAKEAILKMQANDKQLLPLMLKALKDEDPAVQQGAAYTMSRFGADGVQPLMEVLQGPNEKVHWAAVDTLDTIGPIAQPSFELLAKTAVSHPSEKVRKGALIAMLTIHLGFLTGSKQEFRKEPARAISTVVDSLQSKYGRNRWEAVEILAALGPAAREVLPAVMALQQDKDPRVRESVAKALARIGK